MKFKVMLASVLAIACLGLAACEPGPEHHHHSDPESSVPADTSSEDPISSGEPVTSSEDPTSSSEDPSSSSQHQHEFGEWTVTNPATCTEAGTEQRVCACGETEERSIDALGHLAKTEWEVTKPATVDEEGEEVLKCSRCEAVMETRTIDKLTPPEPEVDPVVLTAANLLGYESTNITYGDGNKTINNVKYVWKEIGAYGNGLQMRTKNGKSSTLYNEDALPGAIKSVKITLNKDKSVFANEHALTFTFGDTSAVDKKTITWDTVADQLSYEFSVGEEGCTYFKLVHSITYSLYVDSIELVF